jgi:C4-dicarboxylate transporter DctM subunit
MSSLPLWASAVIGAAIFFVLMFLKLHVGLSLMAAGFMGFWMTRGLGAAKAGLSTTIFEVASSPILVIIPLFILMGVIAGEGGVIRAAFNTFKNLLGHYRGGLAMATVGSCAAFGAVCGDNIATAAVMNKSALPEMRRYGYDDRLSLGSICAGGNLGILIPPSAAFVVYGFITETSISDLFISGIVPGILLTIMFMAQIWLQCKINPALSPKYEPVSWKQRLISLRGLIGIIVVFGLVMGGLMGGIFTPAEGGAAGSVAIVLVSLFYRKLTWKALGRSLMDSVKTAAMILLLIMGARYFSYFLTSTEVASSLSNALVEADLNRYLVLIMVRALFHPGLPHGHLVGHDHHSAHLLRTVDRESGLLNPSTGRHHGALYHDRLHHPASGGGGVHHIRHAQRRAHVYDLSRMLAIRGHHVHHAVADHLLALAQHLAAGSDGGRRLSEPGIST